MLLSELLNRLRTKLPWYIPLNIPVQAYSPRRRLKNMLRRNMTRNSGRQWIRLRKAMNKKGLSIEDIPKTPESHRRPLSSFTGTRRVKP